MDVTASYVRLFVNVRFIGRIMNTETKFAIKKLKFFYLELNDEHLNEKN